MDKNELAEYREEMAVAMKRNGWKNNEIAEKLGTSQNAISRVTAWIKERRTYTFAESREVVDALEARDLSKRIKSFGHGKLPQEGDWCIKIGNDYDERVIEKLRKALKCLGCIVGEPLIYHRPLFKGIEIFIEDRSEDHEV